MSRHSLPEFCTSPQSFISVPCHMSDRRAIVKDPLLYEDPITARKVIISISLLWIPPTVVSLGPFLGWGGYQYNPMIYACGQRWDSESTFPLLIISFVVPLFIIFASNDKVIKVARRLEREVTVQLGKINNEGDNQMLQDSQNGTNYQQQDETPQQEDQRQTGQAIATEEETGEEPLELFKKRLRKVELVNLEDEPNGINGEQQDEAIIESCNQEEQPEKAIVEKVVSEDASALCKKTLQRVEEVNLEDKHCESDAGCGSNKKDNSKRMKRLRATKEPVCGLLHSQPPTLAMCRENSVSPAGVQQRNPKNTKSNAQEGLVTILRECTAARDVMVIMGAFLVCFLPLWVHGIYRAIMGMHHSSFVSLCVNSAYATTTIWNAIIYSVCKKEFSKAVRKLFKM